MNNQNTAGFATRFQEEFVIFWGQLPNKGLFFALLVAWLALFQFLGSSTLGYVDTPSLFGWMHNAYNKSSAVSDDEHGKVVPLVVLALFWWKRKELLAQPLSAWWPAVFLVALAAGVHVLGYLVQQPRISIVALFLGIYALMGLAWGPRWLRVGLFPFCLFVFCVPLGSLAEPITFPLRLLVSKLVAWICQYILAIDVVADGTRLFKAPMQYEYEVAAACSGIRSLISITGIAVLYAFVAFRCMRNRLLLIAMAVPLAVVGNTCRMLLIVLTAEWRGQRAGMWVHENWFFSLIPYIPAIVGLLLVGHWIEKRLPDQPAAREIPTQPPPAR